MKRKTAVREYFLQVVRAGEYPRWPRPEDELVINHRPLGSGYVQCWAFLREDDGDPREIPPAEILAQRFPESKPLIVIDQPIEGLLELVLVKDRHAFAHTFSSVENLEDNIESIVDFAKKKFDIRVDNFMTTGNIGPDIEKKLDAVEKDGEESMEELSTNSSSETDEVRSDIPDSSDSWEIKKVRTSNLNPFPGAGSFNKGAAPRPSAFGRGEDRQTGSSSKFSVVLPLVVLLAVFAGLIANRETISGKINGKLAPVPTPTLAPTPTPTPTPTPVERKQYKLRVLNGTNKTGAASALAVKLKDLGWQVIETGNAKVRGVEQTTITPQESFEAGAATLKQDLSGQYEASLSGILKSSEEVDAEIVIGGK